MSIFGSASRCARRRGGRLCFPLAPLDALVIDFYCWRVGGTPLCAGAPRGVVPPCGPPAVLCAPLWWARAPCAAPPCGGFLLRVLVPPRGVVAPTETIAMTA